MSFIDERGNTVDLKIEEMSRQLCKTYIQKTDKVLEFGARYGTVSVFLAKMLENEEHLVAVEPDPNVIECLNTNKINNNSKFNILHGVVSNKKQIVVHHDCVWEQKTYNETMSIPANRKVSQIKNYSIEDVEKLYNIKFNALVADCEGYLIEFFENNKEFIRNLDVLIYEEDCTETHPINGISVNYNELEYFLQSNGFVLKEDLVDNINLHNKVWSKR